MNKYLLYCSVPERKQKNDLHINQYCLNNFATLPNIQHAIENRSLKGPALRSADKYTTLLDQLSRFSNEEFFRTRQLFAEFSLVRNFF